MLFWFENRVPLIPARGHACCGTLHYHWWTAFNKLRLLFSPCRPYVLRTSIFLRLFIYHYLFYLFWYSQLWVGLCSRVERASCGRTRRQSQLSCSPRTLSSLCLRQSSMLILVTQEIIFCLIYCIINKELDKHVCNCFI